MKKLHVLLAELAVLAFAFLQMASGATTYYVTTNGAGDGSSWASPTNSIQGAIDSIDSSNSTNTVWVSNGVYEVGGIKSYPTGTLLTNRVAIWKAITVRSANNDPTNTLIKGHWDPTTTNGPAAVRCVYMTDGSSLIGFTLTNGATLTNSVNSTDSDGGGVWSQSTNTIISNCVIAGNSAFAFGGGARYGTLYNCTLIGNSAQTGGGTDRSTVYDCTISRNSSAGGGGGSHYGTLYNCTLITNVSASDGGGSYGSALYTCTLTSNSANGANGGGGAYYGTLSNCTIVGNRATAGDGGGVNQANMVDCRLYNNYAVHYGGGVNVYNNYAAHYGGSVNACTRYTSYNCTLIGNSGGCAGGGVYGGTLSNCTLIGNSGWYGGGAYDGILSNCTLIGNSGGYGGGACYGTLYNCAIISNSGGYGGGVFYSTLYNCIVYSNTADTGNGPNWSGITGITNSCTIGGTGQVDSLTNGNITGG